MEPTITEDELYRAVMSTVESIITMLSAQPDCLTATRHIAQLQLALEVERRKSIQHSTAIH